MTQTNTSPISPKIMFLAAIGKPHTLPDGTQLMANLVSGPLLRMLKLLEGLKIVVVALRKSEV